jgi:hypothetical protein
MEVNYMRIATVVQGTRADFEQRKKLLARREMDQAYKKHAKYTEKNNPMLQALENLLSGKTEKELHEKDQVLKNEQNPDERVVLPEVEQEVKEHAIVPKDERSVSGEKVSIQAPPVDSLEETIQILERLRQSALAPVSPSPQDLRVAASAAAQIKEVHGEISEEKFEEFTEEEAPYVNESFQVDIPERFQSNVERNAQAETVFGKDLEKMLFNRTFMKAKAVYATQAEMVKNSYRSYNEPLFSRTA